MVQPYYEQSGVTIYHGDCAAILPSFGAKSFDVVVTKDESELLIALLTYLEQHLATCPYDEIEAALKDLRPLRSRLLAAYLADRLDASR